MTAPTPKDLVLAYVEAFNAYDMKRLREIFAPDAKIWGVLGHGDLDFAEPIWGELHHGMEMRLEVLDLLVEGDKVAARYHETGRFVGPFRGLAGKTPTGRRYEVPAIEWFETANGRITARWGARNSASIELQVLD